MVGDTLESARKPESFGRFLYSFGSDFYSLVRKKKNIFVKPFIKKFIYLSLFVPFNQTCINAIFNSYFCRGDVHLMTRSDTHDNHISLLLFLLAGNLKTNKQTPVNKIL